MKSKKRISVFIIFLLVMNMLLTPVSAEQTAQDNQTSYLAEEHETSIANEHNIKLEDQNLVRNEPTNVIVENIPVSDDLEEHNYEQEALGEMPPRQLEQSSQPLMKANRISGATSVAASNGTVTFKVLDGPYLDRYLYREDGPIKFDIDLQGMKVTEDLTLRLKVYDVDSTSTSYKPEIDVVSVNGHKLGTLTGSDSQWSTVTLNVPAKYLNKDINSFVIDIDTAQEGWAVQLDYAELIMKFNIGVVNVKSHTINWKIEEVLSKKISESGKPSKSLAGKVNSKIDYKYEVDVDDKASISPGVKTAWYIYDESGQLVNHHDGSNNQKNGWKGTVSVSMPNQVGKYRLKVVTTLSSTEGLFFKTYNKLKEEVQEYTLYVLMGKPSNYVTLFNETVQCNTESWIKIATEWAKGAKTKEEVATQLTRKIHKNPEGWHYGYKESSSGFSKNDVQTLFFGSGVRYSDCYVFSDSLNALASALGVKIQPESYKGVFLTRNFYSALDDNEASNVFTESGEKAQRWRFISHAYSKLDGKYYDPTFGIAAYSNPAENMYALEENTKGYITRYRLIDDNNQYVVTSPKFDLNGWQETYWGWGHYTLSAIENIKSRAVTKAIGTLVAEDEGEEEQQEQQEQVITNEQSGLIEYLKVPCNLQVGTGGRYTLYTYLTTEDGITIASGMLEPEHGLMAIPLPPKSIELEEGENLVEIYFDGFEVSSRKVNGPYNVKVVLVDKTQTVVNEIDYVTNSYNYYDFIGCLYKDIVVLDNGVKSENTGLYDSLDINMKLDVVQPGSYRIQGALYKEGITVGEQEIEVNLEKLNQNVTLSFGGESISRSKQDGPYYLEMTISGSTYTECIEYNTQYYDHKSFKGLEVTFADVPEQQEVDADKNGRYEELVVEGNINASKFGTYSLNCEVSDAEGIFINYVYSDIEINTQRTPYCLSVLGEDIFESEMNGPYTLRLSLYDEDGEEVDNSIITTKVYQYTDFEMPVAMIRSIVGDTIDNNELVIGVDIVVNEEGEYSLDGILTDSTYRNLADAINTITLDKGEHQLELRFSGEDILKGGIDGPYLVPNINLAKSDEFLGRIRKTYTTNSYSYLDFTSSDVIIYDTFTELANDANQNGKYDNLDVSIDVFVPKAGTYNYNARIVDENGREISWSSNNKTLQQGKQAITLTFDGRLINGNGVDGPYYVKDLSINNNQNGWATSIRYETKAYSCGEFEACNTIYGTVMAGKTPVKNANVFINGIDKAETTEDGSYVLKVVNSGTYQVQIVGPEELAPWEVWINGQKHGEGNSVKLTINQGQNIQINFVSTRVHSNISPILSPIGDKTVKAGENLEINVEASDPDGDNLIYSAENLPDGAIFDAYTGKFTWTPEYSQEGLYQNIIFKVSDGTEVVQEIISIKVKTAKQLKIVTNTYQTALKTNTIAPNFVLTNTGEVSIKLEDIAIRYYYTVDSAEPQNFWCDWCSTENTNVLGEFKLLDETKEDADCYLEITFKDDGSKVLEPGEKIQLNSRISKRSWTNYNQDNDYSFQSKNGQQDRVSVYIGNELNYGNEPPKTTQTFTKQMMIKNFVNNQTTASQLKCDFDIINTGTDKIKLSDVSVRYYFTAEEVDEQKYICDWINRSQADLEAKIVKISPVDDKLIGYYLEITFNNIEDYIYPDEVITIKGRITNRNNLSYTQSDDYSYNINSSNYPINEKVTLYIAGKLNWGKEPNDL